MLHSGKRIVNMVLYSRSQLYDEMYKITREYYKRFENVITIYYLFSGKEGEPYIDGDILYLPGNESIVPGILNKTIATFSHVWKNYPNYDYYLRTNISTIIDINQFLKRVETETIGFGGHFLDIGNGYRDFGSGINDDRYDGLLFPWGAAIIFSKETFKLIMDNVHQFDRTVVDDVSIGHIAKKLEIVPVQINFDVNVEIPTSTTPLIYRNSSPDRYDDVKRMREIIKYI